MSRTVNDLVDAMQPTQEYRFDPEAVWQGSLRRARRRRVRRSALTLAAGVAAVAAITAPTMILTAGSRGEDPMLPGESASSMSTTSMPAPPTVTPSLSATPLQTRAALSETLREVIDDEWLILPTETNAHVQRANVLRAAGPTAVATVEVYELGEFDSSLVLGGVQTTVDGEPAYYAWLPDSFLAGGETRPAIAWQQPPDTWVVVRATPEMTMVPESGEVPAELLEIASRVELGAPEPIRLPFRVGDRPDRLVPVSVTHYSAPYPDRTVYYEAVDAPVDVWDAQRDLYFALHISMRPAEPAEWQPNTTVGGRPAMRVGLEMIIPVNDDVWVDIGSGAAADPLTMEEIEQIYAGLTFADWYDQSTWFDANSAV